MTPGLLHALIVAVLSMAPSGSGIAEPPAVQDPQPPSPPSQPPPSSPAQVQLSTSKALNPDISVIGNFIGAAGKNDVNPSPPLDLSEVEMAFQTAIDPYSRADFFIAASPEGVEVEEGFITFTALPWHLLLKAGKMRAQFGKVNTLHTHMLPTVDRPLVTNNLVGGEEGLSDAGMSLAHLVNNPHVFLELTGEVYRGDSEVFQSDRNSKLVYVGRVRAYRDLTESSNIDLGLSTSLGPALVGAPESEPLDADEPEIEPLFFDKRLVAVDVTFRYRPLQRAIYRRLNVRTELVWSRQDLPFDAQARSFGFYALGEYQFARRWYIGGRLDRSERTFDDAANDASGSVFMTFWPTEFSQIRGQFRRTNYAEGLSGNEFLFQFNFSIGAHGAHVF
jgi:hypothetical protein